MSAIRNSEVSAFKWVKYTIVNSISLGTSHTIRNTIDVRISGVSAERGSTVFCRRVCGLNFNNLELYAVVNILSMQFSKARARAVLY